VRFRVLISKDALSFLVLAPTKSQRLIREHCLSLAGNPYPSKTGDKKRLHLGNYELFRMNAGHSYTVFYRILRDEEVAKILDIMTFEQAHRRYGRL
jgi:mRNA-degrading endonuclease RelE of RelBE toxin-antitoxin system